MLKMYFPDWTKKQIEKGQRIILIAFKGKNSTQAIASYLKKSAEASSLVKDKKK